MEAARASLTRLGTDYIDVYYLHREDKRTPLAESVRTMGDLQRAGLIRYFRAVEPPRVARGRNLPHLR